MRLSRDKHIREGGLKNVFSQTILVKSIKSIKKCSQNSCWGRGRVKINKSYSENDYDLITVINYDQNNGTDDFLLWPCSQKWLEMC